jgi:polyisoprenoid-binding protein YceI
MKATHRRAYPQLPWHTLAFAILTLLCLSAFSAAGQEISFQLDPAQTSVKWTLGDVLHTVHGTFHLKQGALQFEPASGKISGEIVVDARSGESGSGMRDRKMHKEILESDRFPEIAFRPDKVEGTVANQGKSSVKVHGLFSIHGVDREIMVPAEVEMSGDHWTAAVHFTVPYAKWGMRNPSTLFLRVNDTVEIDLIAAGSVSQHPGATHSQ